MFMVFLTKEKDSSKKIRVDYVYSRPERSAPAILECPGNHPFSPVWVELEFC